MSISTPRMASGNSKGEGSQKPIFLKESMNQIGISRGMGRSLNQESLTVKFMDVFWNSIMHGKKLFVMYAKAYITIYYIHLHYYLCIQPVEGGNLLKGTCKARGQVMYAKVYVCLVHMQRVFNKIM